MENAKLIEGVGKTYGGTPVLLKTVSSEEAQAKQAASALTTTQVKKIAKFAWNDETSKVKIYIDTAQFTCEIAENCVTVDYQSEAVDISVVDPEGTTHILKFDK